MLPVEPPPTTLRKWLRRSEPEDRALSRSTIPPIFLPRASNGEPVTTRNALNLVDVWGCVRCLAGTAATLPNHAYRRTPDGRERVRGLRGVSPIRQCRDALGLASALTRHASESASGGYRPDGVVTVREGAGRAGRGRELVHALV